MTPKPGETWKRRRNGERVRVVAITNPVGKTIPPYVVIEGKRASAVRLGRWSKDFRK